MSILKTTIKFTDDEIKTILINDLYVKTGKNYEVIRGDEGNFYAIIIDVSSIKIKDIINSLTDTRSRNFIKIYFQEDDSVEKLLLMSFAELLKLKKPPHTFSFGKISYVRLYDDLKEIIPTIYLYPIAN